MTASFEVVLTDSGARDATAISDYLVQFEGVARADAFLVKLAEVIASLAHFPERGSRPRDLAQAGAGQYRQIMWDWYRLIYRVEHSRVVIYLIADGRRDLRTLMAQRLLGT